MKKIWMLCLAAALAALTACGAPAPETPDWAPGEGEKLVIYTSHKEEVYRPLVREFEERTGIWVEVVTGGTNALLERIAGESADPQADLMFGGGVESLESYRDYFQPYQAAQSDSIQETFQAQGGWTPFSALPVVLIYNTKLVDPERLTGWEDLTRPEFRGRIAFADPEVSGSSFTALATWLLVRDGDQEAALTELSAALGEAQLQSSGEVLSAVADGTCLVGITLEETAMKRIAAGEDMALVYPREGTSCVPDGSTLVLGAPHEENAKRFLDFTLSREVQELLTSQFYRRSVRRDVPPGEALRPLEEIPVLDYDVQWASENRERILSDWAFFRKEEDT